MGLWKALAAAPTGLKVFGGVSIVCGAIVAIPPAYAVLDPLIPVVRFYMRDHVAQKIADDTKEMTKAIYGLQIQNAERDCNNVASDVITKSAELSKETDEIQKQRKIFQIEQRKNEYHSLDATLRGWRGRGCPSSLGQ